MAARKEVPEVHVGCSGWYYWKWRSVFYPHDLPERSWFPHYTQHFDTVELNAPFYKWPKPATVKTWVRQAPDGFRYSVKVNQLITHEKRFARTGLLMKEFCGLSEVLGDKMGCFLFQFPPSFHYSRDRLRRLVQQLPCVKRPVVEFRHKSWWRESVYEALAEADVTFCSLSAPRLPDLLVHGNHRIYVRLHGVKQWYRYDYSREELTAWAERIAASGAREIWVYFDNDAFGYAPKNAKVFEQILRSYFRKGRKK